MTIAPRSVQSRRGRRWAGWAVATASDIRGDYSEGVAGWGSNAAKLNRNVVLAQCAYAAYHLCMQYTVRGIPTSLDSALRERARVAGKSLNEAAIEALAEGAGLTGAPRKRRNLAHIAGTWKTDKGFDEALAAQDRVDEDLWK